LLARGTVALFEPGPSGLAARSADFVHAAEQATLLSLVPSMLSLLLDSDFVAAPKLRAVLLGGDSLKSRIDITRELSVGIVTVRCSRKRDCYAVFGFNIGVVIVF